MSIHSRYRAGLWHPYQKPMYGVLLNPYHPLARGLVGCWLFNEGGGNTVFDLSGHGNHGSLGGGTAGYCPTWTAVKFGSALNFDGSNDYVDCGNHESLNITDEITIEAWVKTSTLQTNKYIVSKPKTETGSNGWDLNTGDSDNKLRIITSGISPWSFQVDANIYDGVCHHLIGEYDGTKHYIYIDGALIDSQDATGSIETNANNLYIGRLSNYGLYFNGTIALVRIYNRGLSSKEIWQLYTDPFCMFYHPLEAELLYAAAPPAGIVPQAMHHYYMLREV